MNALQVATLLVFVLILVVVVFRLLAGSVREFTRWERGEDVARSGLTRNERKRRL